MEPRSRDFPIEPKARHFQCLGPTGFNRMHYWEWGLEQADRTVLCVHGLTRNGRDFDDLAEALAGRGARVVCPDILGRGDSEWLLEKEGYAFEQYVSDCAQLMARLGGGPVDWVGTSMGGIIGQMTAAGQNAPIRRMVLNDIGPFLDKAGLERIKGYVGNDPTYETYDQAEAAINAVTDKFGPMNAEQRAKFCRLSIRQRDDGTFTTNYDPKIAWLFKETEIVEDVDMWALWPLIQCPVLVMRGAESDLLSTATAARMAAEGPKAEVYEVPGVGHAPALMTAAEIERIVAFLETP